MQRILNLNSHFESQALSLTQANLTQNLLEEYRLSSKIYPELIKKFYWREIDLELQKKFEKIYHDKEMFPQQQDQPETDRFTKINQGNMRWLHILEEAKKIMSIEEIMYSLRNFAAFSEPTQAYDESIQTKYIANFQLYLKTINLMGTEKHKIFADRCTSGYDIGCFALTELGHGSNYLLSSLLTTNVKAHIVLQFNQETETFDPVQGITIGDCGKKEGLDTIDNGFLIFKDVRIPKDNLLNKLSDIDQNDKFQAKIKSADQRFALQLGALSGGRVILIMASQTGLQQALKIAIRYSILRKQFGNPGTPNKECSLIDYKTHQVRLFPLVASSIAFIHVGQLAISMWDACQKNILQLKNPFLAEIHAISSVLKAMSSWSAYKGVMECRQACGGNGISHYSKFGIIMNNMDVNQTWEGDNNVLLQQTAKYLLGMYNHALTGQTLPSETLYWIKEFVSQDDRRNKKEMSNDEWSAWNNSQTFAKDMVLAYGDNLIVREFAKYLQLEKGKPEINQDTYDTLNNLFLLDALTRIKEKAGQFHEAGIFLGSQNITFLIESTILDICSKLKPHILSITDIFPQDNEKFTNILGPDDGDLYKSIKNKLFSEPHAFDKPANWKELLQNRNSKFHKGLN
eukprot:403375781